MKVSPSLRIERQHAHVEQQARWWRGPAGRTVVGGENCDA